MRVKNGMEPLAEQDVMFLVIKKALGGRMKYINKGETDSARKFTSNESIVGNMSSTNHKVLVELLKSIIEKQ